MAPVKQLLYTDTDIIEDMLDTEYEVDEALDWEFYERSVNEYIHRADGGRCGCDDCAGITSMMAELTDLVNQVF